MTAILTRSIPVLEVWEWQMYGSCRGLDSSIFYSPDGERGRVRADRVRRAKRICLQCPVLDQCREFALSTSEQHGVWGGLSEDERRRVQEDKGIRAPLRR